jgi:FixJ family two-component response regulator
MQPPPSSSAPATRRYLLLVEDDDGVRRSLQLALHAHRYDVRAYALAGQLLADPAIHDAAYLVADYRLADGDGIAVRRALAEMGWRGRSVLITASAAAALQAPAIAAGYDAVLEKPLRLHALIAVLDGAALPRP